MTSFLVDENVADDQGVAVADTFAIVSGVAAVVTTFVGTAVGWGVVISVGTSVAATVVGTAVAVTAGFACCVVHPLAAARRMTRMNKPVYVFIK